jgi:putative DNA primase/helicase
MLAKTNDPSTWASLDQALAVFEKSNGFYQGPGFVFRKGARTGGVDFDNCLRPNGEVKDWARPLIKLFGHPRPSTFMEVTPSQRGLHAWAHFELQKGRKIEFYIDNEKCGFESYSSGRYFTITGNRWHNAPLLLGEHQQAVEDGLRIAEEFAKQYPLPNKLLRASVPISKGKEANQTNAHASSGDPDDEFIHEGSRHEAIKRFAVRMQQAGFGEREVRHATHAYNQQFCRPPHDARHVDDIIAWVVTNVGNDACADDWPEPSPLGCELPQVQQFSTSLLPEVLREPVEDLADRMQVPEDFPSICAVVTLAGSVNRRATLQPKRQDSGWIITPNCWGMIVAQPGFLKSPVLAAATAPLCAIENLWREQYMNELEEFKAEQEQMDLRIAAWKELSKAAHKKNAAQPVRPDTSLRPPTQKRLILTDSTFEKTHELLAENPAGLMILRDELVGWLAQLDRQGREGERGFSLECWNGNSGFTIDRISRGSVYVPACCLSLLGCVTPGRLRSYLAAALDDTAENDGLIQRFQLAVWPDAPKHWKYVDRPPKPNRIADMLKRLTALDAELPERYTFDAEAQDLFVEWLGDLESRIRGNTLHSALVSHLSKLRKTMPSLALLFALADGWETPIKVGHTKQAIDFCRYLESHAGRIYSCVTTARMQAAATLAEKLRAGAVGADGTFARRDVYRHHWTGLDTPERVQDALEILEDARWVRPKAPEGGMGRPSDLWIVNPRAYKTETR